MNETNDMLPEKFDEMEEDEYYESLSAAQQLFYQ